MGKGGLAFMWFCSIYLWSCAACRVQRLALWFTWCSAQLSAPSWSQWGFLHRCDATGHWNSIEGRPGMNMSSKAQIIAYWFFFHCCTSCTQNTTCCWLFRHLSNRFPTPNPNRAFSLLQKCIFKHHVQLCSSRNCMLCWISVLFKHRMVPKTTESTGEPTKAARGGTFRAFLKRLDTLVLITMCYSHPKIRQARCIKWI